MKRLFVIYNTEESNLTRLGSYSDVFQAVKIAEDLNSKAGFSKWSVLPVTDYEYILTKQKEARAAIRP